MTSGGNPYYYVTDNQGAPSALVDNSGAKQGRWDHSPTGNARSGNSASVDQPFGYTGAYLDSSGLYKRGARYYDPSLGRFTQPDPSGKENNTYLYAGGDAVNRTDPTELFSFGDVTGPSEVGSFHAHHRSDRIRARSTALRRRTAPSRRGGCRGRKSSSGASHSHRFGSGRWWAPFPAQGTQAMTLSLIMPPSAAGQPAWAIALIFIVFVLAVLFVFTRRR
ncbi:RHS repeat-associated core domain-containing protein [Streptomyces griseoluteus]